MGTTISERANEVMLAAQWPYSVDRLRRRLRCSWEVFLPKAPKIEDGAEDGSEHEVTKAAERPSCAHVELLLEPEENERS